MNDVNIWQINDIQHSKHYKSTDTIKIKRREGKKNNNSKRMSIWDCNDENDDVLVMKMSKIKRKEEKKIRIRKKEKRLIYLRPITSKTL